MKRVSILFILFACIIFNAMLVYGAADDKVVAYYFHTKFRCHTCHKIEQFTEEALKEYFPEELDIGKLVYKVINIQEKENKHFVKDYQLFTKSFVLALFKNGEEIRFKNLDQVWQQVGDKQKFYEYIKKETHVFLDELNKE